MIKLSKYYLLNLLNYLLNFSSLDWSSMQLAAPLYALFLGTDALATQKEVKQDMKRIPASIRIRLKLLFYLCRVTKAGFIIPSCIQVI